LSRARGLIAFKVYPLTPGEYQKARFYPFSPGTVGRSSTAILWPGPGPNYYSLYSRGEPKGKVLSVQPRPRRQTELRSFWPGLSVYSRRVPKGKVLSVQPGPGGRLSCDGRPRGLISFKGYPFTPGDNQKARFYPFSPATVGKRRRDGFLGRPRGLILTMSFDFHEVLVVFGIFGIRF
jgi:hypothetical protein